MTQPVWHILGAGAIGSLFACALSQADSETRLITRPDQSGDVATRDINISSQFGVRACQAPLSPPQSNTPIEYLLVTTKAYDVRAAVAANCHRFSETSRLVLMVNGMGVAEELESDYPKLEIYCATTTEGAYRNSNRDIVHAGSGLTQIGRGTAEHAPPWFESWQKMSLGCSWVNDIEQTLWEKLAVNCAINPLTAVSRCRNGKLATEAVLRTQLEDLCSEIATVTAAMGYQVLAERLVHRVLEVVRATANNRSSMLQDVLAGRQTEIDYITGHLLKTAAIQNIPVPLNSAIFAEVQQLDA
ncbi:MAG: 2-dehydropantoate 2-reductase [Halioglobus sp.]